MIIKKLFILIVCLVVVCLCLVSCGSVMIPDMTSVDEESAKNLLASNGLVPVIVYEYSDVVDKGCVVRSEPAIGSSVQKNSIVILYVSKGVELKVPDVSNVDEETAKNMLFSSGFFSSIIYEYSEDIPKGYVTRTEPGIGSIVEPDTIINIYISCGRYYIEPQNVDITLDESVSMAFCDVYKKADKIYINCHDFCFMSYSEWYDPEDTGYIQGKAFLQNFSYGTNYPIYAKYPIKSWQSPINQDFTIEIPWNNQSSLPKTVSVTMQFLYKGRLCEYGFELVIIWE